ncbi:MAG: YceI family protein [Rickettsiales bacterium]|nr:YceI family protein [Rickettsiales bacterium]
MKKLLTIFAVFYFTTSAFAADVTTWKIVPTQSRIDFKVSQDGSNIVGYFKKFDGKINFDKNQLNKSKVAIEIDTNSVVVSLAEASRTLQNLEWLSTKAFPKATFSAEKFSGSGKNFKADGNLTIKGRTAPASLTFTFEESAPNKAHVVGKTTLKRSAFGVGNSDVKKANGVKDEVEVSFVVNAEK